MLQIFIFARSSVAPRHIMNVGIWVDLENNKVKGHHYDVHYHAPVVLKELPARSNEVKNQWRQNKGEAKHYEHERCLERIEELVNHKNHHQQVDQAQDCCNELQGKVTDPLFDVLAHSDRDEN